MTNGFYLADTDRALSGYRSGGNLRHLLAAVYAVIDSDRRTDQVTKLGGKLGFLDRLLNYSASSGGAEDMEYLLDQKAQLLGTAKSAARDIIGLGKYCDVEPVESVRLNAVLLDVHPGLSREDSGKLMDALGRDPRLRLYIEQLRDLSMILLRYVIN